MSKMNGFNKLILLAVCLVTHPSFAQDDQAVEEQSTSQANDERENQPSSNEPEISNTNVEDQVFIPSEEISEDAPVAFPVDI